MYKLSNYIIIVISGIISYILLNKFFMHKSYENNNYNDKYIKSKSIMYAFIFMIMFYLQEIIGLSVSILLGSLGIYLADNILSKYNKK